MSITLIQADNNRVPPTDDARLYQLLASGAEGLVEGCQITSKGGRLLHITSGWGMAQGRCFKVIDQDITVAASTRGAQKGRLWVRIQPSQSPAVSLQTVAAASLPPLVREDINYGGQTLDVELATYNINEVAVSGLSVTARRVSNPGSAVYTATLRLGGWSKQSGSWTQTVACDGMGDFDTTPPWIVKTGNPKTDQTLQDALDQLRDGCIETLPGQIKATVYSTPPTTDIQIYMQRVELPTA